MLQLILLTLTIVFGIITVMSGTSWATERIGSGGKPRGDAASYLCGAIASMYLAGLTWVAFLISLR